MLHPTVKPFERDCICKPMRAEQGRVIHTPACNAKQREDFYGAWADLRRDFYGIPKNRD